MSRGESWSGRVCCPIPQSNSCRRACITATSDLDLVQGCRQSDEIEFFHCLERQKNGEECCSNARNDDCNQVCLEIFRSRWTPNPSLRVKVQEICETNSPKVMECVKDFIKVTPAKDLHKSMSSTKIFSLNTIFSQKNTVATCQTTANVGKPARIFFQ